MILWRALLPCLFLALWSFPDSRAAETPAAQAEGAALDEVLVTGERPGPGLWRVSRGDDGHELWILATLEPLPNKMTWRSRAVETRIAASQAVIAPPVLDAQVGFFRGLTLLPSLFNARKTPSGETLEQVLPHPLYIRWLALRVKYLGSSGDETLRPMLAALDLYMHALTASGLTTDTGVWAVVEKAAHEHRMPIISTTLKLPVEDPKGTIRELAQIPRSAEIECLEKTIDRLETDLLPMRQRANAWSVGDVDALRSLPLPPEEVACLDALSSLPRLREQMQRAKTQLADGWLAAANKALLGNASSFAVLPIGDLLLPDGLLARLRAAGYIVQSP